MGSGCSSSINLSGVLPTCFRNFFILLAVSEQLFSRMGRDGSAFSWSKTDAVVDCHQLVMLAYSSLISR